MSFTAMLLVGLLAAPPTLHATQRLPVRQLKVLDPVEFQQLQVFPVAFEGAPLTPVEVVPLELALRRGDVVASEMENATVRAIRLENRSAKPVAILGGEVIGGGNQDRVFSSSLFLPPRTAHEAEVYCVEHGRWSSGHEFGKSLMLADSRIRLRALREQDQSAVWGEVARVTSELKANTPTGTYLAIAEPAGERAVQPFRKAIPEALARVPRDAPLVGLVVAVNGRIVSADVFADARVFGAYARELLESAYVSAARARFTAGARATRTEAERFVKEPSKLSFTSALTEPGGEVIYFTRLRE